MRLRDPPPFSFSAAAALLLLSFLLQAAAAKSFWNDGSNDCNSVSIDDSCQLRLYRVQQFQGSAFILSNSRRRLRGLEKSLKSVGRCCWALYAHKNFKGRPMYLGGKISMASTLKWGWRRNRIRSVKRLDSCQEP